MATTALPIWEDPTVFEINRLPMTASMTRCGDRHSALNGGASDRYLLLNGSWRFRYLPGQEGWDDAWVSPDLEDGGWDEIAVPGVWQLQGYGIPYYRNIGLPPGIDETHPPRIDPDQNSLGCYRRAFDLPPAWQDKEVRLHFGGVKAAFRVWLNGVELGYSQDSWLPAEFGITDLLVPGQNQLTVLVYRFCDGSFLEDQDMWYLNGIFREVYLYAVPSVHVADFFLRSSFDGNYRDAVFEAGIVLGNTSAREQEARLSVELLDPEGAAVCAFSEAILLAGTDRTTLEYAQLVEAPRKWSAEDPALYTALISLLDGKDRLLEAIPVQFGFRQVEIIDRQITLNGKPVIFKGVNRHEFDPRGGYTQSRECMEAQVKLLKRFNINAVRTSHYPAHPWFYDLCDRYGIYVMDEANLESHSFVRHLPRGKPAWREAVISRGRRMVLRDRNHPSVVFWSLGNEAGQGENFGHMRREMLALDQTRPIHYEGEYTYPHSDLVSLMYPSPDFLEKLARGKGPLWFFKAEGAVGRPVSPRYYRGKPILVCEYAHAMGNSVSRLDRFMDVFETYPNCAGGFIWDLVDQSLLREEQDGSGCWTYGGDWGDEPNDGNFCINGLFQPDLKPNPQAYEVQKVYQPLGLSAGILEEGELILYNKHAFLTLDHLEARWTWTVDGKEQAAGRIPVPPVPPGERGLLRVPPPHLEGAEGKECHLLVELTLKEAAPWAEKGFRIGWEQFSLPLQGDHSAAPDVRPPTTPLLIHPREDLLEILVQELKLTFNTTTGYLEALDNREMPLLIGPLKPNFYREIDNDLLAGRLVPGLGHLFVLNQQWKNGGEELQLEEFRVERGVGGSVLIAADYSFPQGIGPLRFRYLVDPAGNLEIRCQVRPCREMLRFGLQVPLARELSEASWYGRGPHETMPDRKAGGWIAIHHLPSSQLHFPYIRPQENGNRSDVRWVEFADPQEQGLGIYQLGKETFNFSLWPYSQDDLLQAKHSCELPDRAYYTLNLDLGQRGVGDLFSLMYGRDPASRLRKGKTYQLEIRIAPVSGP